MRLEAFGTWFDGVSENLTGYRAEACGVEAFRVLREEVRVLIAEARVCLWADRVKELAAETRTLIAEWKAARHIV